MEFENLPNEILIECFGYLNTPDIFYSFDQLNSRFNKLIRNISLHLNFQDTRKLTFDQFCVRILLNPEIKKQIRSLRLSNDGTCGQIKAFLSFFSLDEFISLRSLTLIEVEKNDVNQLKNILPLIPKLDYVHLIYPDADVKGELSLRRRARRPIPPEVLTCHLPLILEISSLTHLTISGCTCRDLSQLFQYAPMLKYLNVYFVSDKTPWTNHYKDFSNHCAIHLQKLIIMEFRQNFETFEILMKQTPNLKSLTLDCLCGIDVIDASRWQNLITTLLPQLTVFKFEFDCRDLSDENIMLGKFEEFHSDFWQKQHHWFTEYSNEEYRRKIYTVPQMSCTTHADYLENKLSIFNTVTNLTIYHKDVLKPSEQYFPNVTTLRLVKSYSKTENEENILLGEEYFQSLKMIVNLSNLKHLSFVRPPEKNLSFLLLHILQETPKLSSLATDADSIVLLFDNNELCKYLKKMIKHVYVCGYDKLFSSNDITEEFCKIFSNIEQFTCDMKDPYYLLFLLERLSNLSIMKVTFITHDDEPLDLSSFEDKIRKLNTLFRTECTEKGRREYGDAYYHTTITIWIDNNRQ